MKTKTPKVIKLESIPEIHRMLGLPGPPHPLITLLDTESGQIEMCRLPVNYILGYYKISFITRLGGKFRYGQGYYDFDEGSLLFTAPNQIISGMESYADNKGYSLLIHPDFLQGHALAKKIGQYGFFAYSANEALHLSEQERTTMQTIYEIIQQELNNRIDNFSHEVLLAQIDLILTYATRFYNRQFLTRQAADNDLLQQMENLLNRCFDNDTLSLQGLPTVQYLAEQLHYTPNYLSDMLRSLTGLNAQQHIHQKLIERSKELLSTTNLAISEVAYSLGFEHPQSFSRLFKLKTDLTPAQFRTTFN